MNNPLTQERGNFSNVTFNWVMAATFSGKRVGLNVLKFPVNNEKELLFAVREQINFLWARFGENIYLSRPYLVGRDLMF